MSVSEISQQVCVSSLYYCDELCIKSVLLCVTELCVIAEMTPSVSVDARLIGFQDAEVEHRGRRSRQCMQRGDQWSSSWWQGTTSVAVVTE